MPYISAYSLNLWLFVGSALANYIFVVQICVFLRYDILQIDGLLDEEQDKVRSIFNDITPFDVVWWFLQNMEISTNLTPSLFSFFVKVAYGTPVL
jgi:hypothetical protein